MPIEYQNNRNLSGFGSQAGVQYDAGLRTHMQRVYNMMGGGLIITALVAWFTAHNPMMAEIFLPNPATGQAPPAYMLAVFAPLAFVLVLSFGINRLSVGAASTIFFLYSAAVGLSISTIFVAYTNESIARTFFITSGTFLAMSLYGYTTRRSLASMGSFMLMGLFGIIIASIVNLFMQSSALQFAVSVLGVVIFTGLTAWDTQRIKMEYAEANGHEANGKLAVMGALSLYMDFINLFMYLLRFFGRRE